VLRQHDGNVAHKGDVRDDAADNVPPLKKVLPGGEELRVVGSVVVALGQQLRIVTVM